VIVFMWLAAACSIGLAGCGVFYALKRRWLIFWALVVLALVMGAIAGYLWIQYVDAMTGWGEIGDALD
jgi:hypothetical protein